MSVRSPSGASSCVTVSMPFGTGMLSPVSADSATSSVAAFSSRPSAGTTSPASIETTSPGTSCSAGIWTSSPLAEDPRLDDHHLLERGDRRRRLALLIQAENGVEQRQEEQDEAGAELVQRPDAPDARDEQDDLHRVAVLAHERAPARLALGGDERVRAVLLEPPRGFVGARDRHGCRRPGRWRRPRPAVRTTSCLLSLRRVLVQPSPSSPP